jgi:glycosyltransferase involved in cell wall biosynthesis
MVSPTSSDLAAASENLLAALTTSAPSGCEVVGIVPSGRAEGVVDHAALAELATVWKAPVPRRQLAAAWRAGTGLGGAGGMIHSPTLMAPLVRHDRAHDHDQTVVTLWSLEAWTAPERLDRGDVAWQRAMLRRATRFADAVVVPTHAMAAQLAEIAPLGARIRVIAGAPTPGFDQTAEVPTRIRALGLPPRYVAVLGRSVDRDGLVWAFRAIAGLDVDVVVVGDGGDDPARVFGLALAEGIPDHRVRAPHVPDSSDRASVLAGAAAVVSASTAPTFPWRALEALATGAPLVAARTEQNEELLAEGAHLAAVDDSDELGEALRRALEDDAFAARLRVLSTDRARAFSWRDAAERVWQLHAEL